MPLERKTATSMPDEPAVWGGLAEVRAHPRLEAAPLPGDERRHVESRLDELAPEAQAAMVHLDGAVWLEPSLRELVEVRTAQLDGSVESLVRHARHALALGESPARLVALSGWHRSSAFTACERAALALADALALLPEPGGLVAARRQAAEYFDERELAQLVFACVAANAWDRLEVGLVGDEAPVRAER